MLVVLIPPCLLILLIQLAYYVVLIPSPADRVHQAQALDRHAGTLPYAGTYVLALLRTPFSIPSYLLKVLVFLCVKRIYRTKGNNHARDALHSIGDLANFIALSTAVIVIAGPPAGSFWSLIVYSSIFAEPVLQVFRRGQMLYRAIWQLLPHRRLAAVIGPADSASLPRRWLARVLHPYCSYYALDDEQRASYILAALKQRSSRDGDLAQRLDYVTAYPIVPRRMNLHGGQIRSVATGEILVHDNWTSDPWLLIGMALRRAPWSFDSRYMRRPFYYRSESNGLKTLFVFQHARHCPPFITFQIGHQILLARRHTGPRNPADRRRPRWREVRPGFHPRATLRAPR